MSDFILPRIRMLTTLKIATGRDSKQHGPIPLREMEATVIESTY